MISDGMKTCTLCKASKPVAEFPKQRNKGDGLASWCKECHRAKSKAWREANPEKAKAAKDRWQRDNPGSHRRSHLRRAYGIELEDYERLLAEQGGKCAICGRAEADSVKQYLCVDHVAGTQKIRGLLCSQCNSAIGLLGHDPALLLRAIEYLAREHVLDGVIFPQGVHRRRSDD